MKTSRLNQTKQPNLPTAEQILTKKIASMNEILEKINLLELKASVKSS